jgi:PAS domain S-box-containing protein
MRLKTVILFSLLLLAWWARALAQESDDSLSETLILSEDKSAYPLGLYLELLEDPGGQLTIEDVTSSEYDGQFFPSEEEVPNFGFTDSAYWARLRLRNENPAIDNWLLEVGFANMHFVDLYLPLANNSGYEVRQTGAMRPPSSRDILHPHLLFDLTLPDQSEQTYYLRFKNGGPMTLPLTLWQPNDFFVQSNQNLAGEMLFLGVMLGLLGYNLFLFISLRDLSYLYLALLLGGIAFFDVFQTSLLEVYLAPDLYRFKTLGVGLSSAAILASLILFNDSFLSIKRHIPWLHRLNLLLVGFAVLLGLSTFFFDYHEIAVVMAPTFVVFPMIVLATVIIAWRRGFQATRFLVIAWIGLLAGLLLLVLGRMDIISNTLISENAYRFGFVWMAVCSSLALADRINLLQAETEKAIQDLKDSEHRLFQTMEAMPVGVVVYGTNQIPNYMNKRTADILSNPVQRIEPDVSAGRTLAEAINYFSFRVAGSDEAYPIDQMPVQRALQGEEASTDDIEADLIDKRVPLEIWASPVFDSDGNVESAVVAFQDITERKQSEMALRASEAHFRVIVENNFEGIIFMDRDRKLVYVSPSYSQLNGFSTEELIGQSGVGFIHPDDQAPVAETFQKLLQQPMGRVSIEYRIKHKNGSWVWIETNALNMLDDPQVKAVVLNSRNITERKETEAELANYRHHLEQLVIERTEELEVINEQLTEEMAERAVLEGLLHKRIQWMSTLALARQRIKGSADLPTAHENLSKEILQMLDAGSLFLIRWEEGGEQVEFRCRPVYQDVEPDSEAIRTSFEAFSPLRRALEPGEIVVLSAGDVHGMPAPIRVCFTGSGMQSLLLAPMLAGESVTGVLGLALSLPKKELSEAQRELITKIALDLANLSREAGFLDQTRALVAAEERNRLARDLHDSVTQMLFTASLVAEVLPRIWQRDPQRAMESLEELRRLTRGALAEMRTMLLELRPSAVAKSPLPDLLAQLTEASTSRVHLPFSLFIEQTPPLPKNVHAAFYRIAQEALNNVIKHARAGNVILSYGAITLPGQRTAENMLGVRLVIEDDGVGFSSENEHMEHLGLGIMRERAADVGAELEIKSCVGEGTRVTLDWCGILEDGTVEL